MLLRHPRNCRSVPPKAPQPDPRRLSSLQRDILSHGHAIGPLFAWHHTRDEFSWLVAELLLRRTTRTAAAKAFTNLTRTCSTWSQLAKQRPSRIATKIAWVGLGKQRSHQLRELARVIQTEFGGRAPRERDQLTALPGIGPYIADALLLYVHRRTAFPLDPNVQRVFRRVFGRPTGIGTRHSDPYRDTWTRSVADRLVKGLKPAQVIKAHRGVLDIAWTSCRPMPRCSSCQLRAHCVSAVRFVRRRASDTMSLSVQSQP